MTSELQDATVFQKVQRAISERLPRNQKIRRNLPGHGRIRIDRQLPFLCLYRQPTDRPDDGTRELVTTEAAYLAISGDSQYLDDVREMVDVVSRLMLEHFGIYLVLEVWSRRQQRSAFPRRPRFRIVAPEAESMMTALELFRSSLESIQVDGQPAEVEVDSSGLVAPPGLAPLFDEDSDHPANCFPIGLEVDPLYQSEETEVLFPFLLQQLRRQLAHAIRRGISGIVGAGEQSEAHYEAYGPSSMVKAVREVDQELSEVAEAFDFLLQVTPVNGDQAWQQFSDSGYDLTPTFYYRPLPYLPGLLKRKLFAIPIERIEDPTLAHLFWDKQVELDRQLSALREIETPNFLLTSLQLYPAVEEELLQLARTILARTSDKCEGHNCEEERLTPGQVARAAREEIDYYHEQAPLFKANVEVCDDIASGIMVSRDKLLISESLAIRTERLVPLLQHEVGTHLVTYFNGRNQPFRQLAAGLAGYEALQEGLAVLSEYLTGGLTKTRVRTLASRVVAVWSVTQGAEFLDTFRLLHNDFGFSPRSAYTTTVRVHRSGGFTKDAVYLRGLVQLLEYLAGGHEIEPLYVGKIALEHVLFIQELRRREIIQPPTVLPRFWQQTDLRKKLEDCRGKTVLDLLEQIT